MSNFSTIIDEVEVLVARAESAAATPSVVGPLQQLSQAASRVHLSWSQSNLGYHAMVYYRGFQEPPAGVRFSQEWGLSGMGMFGPSADGWAERTYQDVVAHITDAAGAAGPEEFLPQVKEAARC